jgi:hypothetical protein
MSHPDNSDAVSLRTGSAGSFRSISAPAILPVNAR